MPEQPAVRGVEGAVQQRAVARCSSPAGETGQAADEHVAGARAGQRRCARPRGRDTARATGPGRRPRSEAPRPGGRVCRTDTRRRTASRPSRRTRRRRSSSSASPMPSTATTGRPAGRCRAGAGTTITGCGERAATRGPPAASTISSAAPVAELPRTTSWAAAAARQQRGDRLVGNDLGGDGQVVLGVPRDGVGLRGDAAGRAAVRGTARRRCRRSRDRARRARSAAVRRAAPPPARPTGRRPSPHSLPSTPTTTSRASESRRPASEAPAGSRRRERRPRESSGANGVEVDTAHLREEWFGSAVERPRRLPCQGRPVARDSPTRVCKTGTQRVVRGLPIMSCPEAGGSPVSLPGTSAPRPRRPPGPAWPGSSPSSGAWPCAAPGIVAVGVAGLLAGLTAGAIARDSPTQLVAVDRSRRPRWRWPAASACSWSSRGRRCSSVERAPRCSWPPWRWAGWPGRGAARRGSSGRLRHCGAARPAETVQLSVVQGGEDHGPGAHLPGGDALSTAALGREWMRTTAALAGGLDPATRRLDRRPAGGDPRRARAAGPRRLRPLDRRRTGAGQRPGRLRAPRPGHRHRGGLTPPCGLHGTVSARMPAWRRCGTGSRRTG